MLWGLAHLESAFSALQRFEWSRAWYADSYVNHLVPNILQCPLRYATVELYTLSQLPERKFGRCYFKLRIVKRKRKRFCVYTSIPVLALYNPILHKYRTQPFNALKQILTNIFGSQIAMSQPTS